MMLTGKENKMYDALESMKSGYSTRQDFINRGLSPSRLDRAIQSGYIKKQNIIGIVEYRLTESGKSELERLSKKLMGVM